MFFRLGVIAHHVFVLFKAIALEGVWHPHQVQTVRWRLFDLAGKVIKTAGGWTLKVNGTALVMLEQIRLRVRAFAFSPS